jgi:hypothetical protein
VLIREQLVQPASKQLKQPYLAELQELPGGSGAAELHSVTQLRVRVGDRARRATSDPRNHLRLPERPGSFRSTPTLRRPCRSLLLPAAEPAECLQHRPVHQSDRPSPSGVPVGGKPWYPVKEAKNFLSVNRADKNAKLSFCSKRIPTTLQRSSCGALTELGL